MAGDCGYWRWKGGRDEMERSFVDAWEPKIKPLAYGVTGRTGGRRGGVTEFFRETQIS